MKTPNRGFSMIPTVWILILMAVVAPASAVAQEDQPGAPGKITSQSPPRHAVMVNVQGPIGPATADFIESALNQAALGNAELVIIRLDTPGGLDTSTRDIVRAILDSPVPVATYVAPEGARAASAGMYILYASHIAAMSPATNVGAATPVAIIGGKSPDSAGKPAEEDEDAAPPAAHSGDTMSRKAVNDAAAYARSLAARHERNPDWAEQAVREAASIPAQEALQIGVIDLIAKNVDDLLAQVNGRTVEVRGHPHVMDTASLRVELLTPDWKSKLLSVITDPTIAYLLLLIGIYGLILEGYHPGAILPGVVGAISLLLALYALQMLPVNFAGVALIVLGLILMIAEAMAPSFGALGFGGIISLVIGSIILIDTDSPGLAVSRPLIGAIALVSALGFMAVIGFAVKARRRPVVSGREELIGSAGSAIMAFDRHGYILAHGERWSAVTESPVSEGQSVVVTGLDGLTLKVRPAKD